MFCGLSERQHDRAPSHAERQLRTASNGERLLWSFEPGNAKLFLVEARTNEARRMVGGGAGHRAACLNGNRSVVPVSDGAFIYPTHRPTPQYDA